MERQGVASIHSPWRFFLALRSQFQVGDAEGGPLRFVGEAFDFPAVGQDDLLHDSEPEAGTLLLGGEIGLEYLGSALVLYPSQAKPVPPPDGLAVARLDGSDTWVKWMKLASIRQADTIYYERR